MENTNFKVYIEEKRDDQFYGRLYLEPLERGYGDTLGNALRRLLLSSIRGAAVTAVRIDGVLHEFSTIPGIREDVIEILMNLKHIPIKAKAEKAKADGEGFKIITLDSDDLPKDFFTREVNPGVVTAKDLPWDNDFEFCGDGVLCTLEPGAHLLMEIYIERGVGYLSAERPRPSQPALPLDALLTDAIFSPVKRVNYKIEPARVGQSIDYESLVLEVWTNGALSPEEAVEQAAEIAKNYFGHVADTVKAAQKVNRIDKGTTVTESGTTETASETVTAARNTVIETASEVDPDYLSRPIHDLELSIRSENCLMRGGIQTIGDLLRMSHDDLLRIRNLGRKSLTEIEERLATLNLKLSPTSISPEGTLAPAADVPNDFPSDKEPKDLLEEINEVAGNVLDNVSEDSDEAKAAKEPELKDTQEDDNKSGKKTAKVKTSGTRSKKKAEAEQAAPLEKAEEPAKIVELAEPEQTSAAEKVEEKEEAETPSVKVKKPRTTKAKKSQQTEAAEQKSEGTMDNSEASEAVEAAEKPKKPRKSKKTKEQDTEVKKVKAEAESNAESNNE